MIEFVTNDGEAMWVGPSHIVSIRTSQNLLGENYTVVKLSDGTEHNPAESAFDLGMRLAKVMGSLASGAVGTPHDKLPADSNPDPRPDRGPMQISKEAVEGFSKPRPR